MMDGRRRSEEDEGEEDEEEKKTRLRRERNKDAAARCRQRKVDRTIQLQQETTYLEEAKKRLENEVEMLKQQKSDLQFIIDAHLHSAHCHHIRSSTVDPGVPIKTESAYAAAAGNRKPPCASFQSPSSNAFQSNDLFGPGAATAFNSAGSMSSIRAPAAEFSNATLSSGCQMPPTVPTGFALSGNIADFNKFQGQPGTSYMDGDTWFDRTSGIPAISTSSEVSNNVAYNFGVWPNITKSL